MAEQSTGEGRGRRSRQVVVVWVVAVAAAFGAAAALVLARNARVQRQAERLEQEVAQGRRVLVAHVETAPSERSLTLPASIRGFIETPVYAKISGYLKDIRVDKGDRVTNGQVLATLESPELDQQVVNARANYQLQLVTDTRNQELVKQDLIAKQVGDESHGAMLQAKATLDQLEATRAYEIIRAPVAGMVAARSVDPGTLIPAVTVPSTGVPILTIATLNPVRIYANVPQSVVPYIHNGAPATIIVTEYPGRRFTGSVTRHPDALSAATHTMLVEVDLTNDDEALYPGMYARMSFTVARTAPALAVPDDALIFRGGKVYVPLVRENRLALSEVSLGYDDGRTVEVTSGVSAGDLIAVNVGQAARDGELLQPIDSSAP